MSDSSQQCGVIFPRFEYMEHDQLVQRSAAVRWLDDKVLARAQYPPQDVNLCSPRLVNIGDATVAIACGTTPLRQLSDRRFGGEYVCSFATYGIHSGSTSERATELVLARADEAATCLAGFAALLIREPLGYAIRQRQQIVLADGSNRWRTAEGGKDAKGDGRKLTFFLQSITQCMSLAVL